MGDKRKPLIGYMVLESYADDYSEWDGQITYPDPTGANLYWEKPIPMIEKSAYDSLRAALAASEARAGEMAKALEGIIAVADRKTKEFDAARAALSDSHGQAFAEEHARYREAVEYGAKYAEHPFAPFRAIGEVFRDALAGGKERG